jgi:uncharacterized protein YijF (DUF1287 family)
VFYQYWLEVLFIDIGVNILIPYWFNYFNSFNIMKRIILLVVFSIPFLCLAQNLTTQKSLSDAALELTQQEVTYDPSYFSIAYPNGDIPPNKGVCTDVIIRAYRIIGIDLQKLVHEDMKANFDAYPKIWGLKKPDKNIDHRRVPNLMTFFNRQGVALGITQKSNDYLPGDVIAWDLGGGITHIGILVDKKSRDRERCLVVHNIGGGQVLEDCLFDYKIIGHYRYK